MSMINYSPEPLSPDWLKLQRALEESFKHDLVLKSKVRDIVW